VAGFPPRAISDFVNFFDCVGGFVQDFITRSLFCFVVDRIGCERLCCSLHSACHNSFHNTFYNTFYNSFHKTLMAAHRSCVRGGVRGALLLGFGRKYDGCGTRNA
jgi:hypothetical protein